MSSEVKRNSFQFDEQESEIARNYPFFNVKAKGAYREKDVTSNAGFDDGKKCLFSCKRLKGPLLITVLIVLTTFTLYKYFTY